MFNLNVLKEVEVTDAYLGMNIEKRNCQIKEPFDDCTTRTIVENILNECMCLPLDIGHINKSVSISLNLKLTELKCKVPICTVEEMECVGLMNKKKSDCYQNCEGLYVTSFIKSDTDERGSSFLRSISADYDLYKGIIKFPINLKSN